jgi:hypothetical protein
MKNYKLVITPMGDEVIQYEDNGVLYTIPKDPANSDYQRYLNPELEQSTPIVMENLTEDQ